MGGKKSSSPNLKRKKKSYYCPSYSGSLTDSSITHLKAGVFQGTILALFLPYIPHRDDIQPYGFNFDKYSEDSKIFKHFPEDTDLPNYL